MSDHRPPLITLTTDLGERDPYTASIKGVLLTQCPGAQVVDLGNQISLHNTPEAALFVLGVVPYFPPETVHLISVSPGPAPLAVRIAGQTVVCPDNGILTLLAEHYEIEGAWAIDVSRELAERSGQIYFGREVFAPAAAKLAGGEEFDSIGKPQEKLNRIDWPVPSPVGKKRLDGRIMHVDRFGNLVTNIHRSHLGELEVELITAGNATIEGLSCSYGDVAPKRCLALFGHTGYLEVAYNGDRANERLGIAPGIMVSVFFRK